MAVGTEGRGGNKGLSERKAGHLGGKEEVRGTAVMIAGSASTQPRHTRAMLQVCRESHGHLHSAEETTQQAAYFLRLGSRTGFRCSQACAPNARLGLRCTSACWRS